MNVHINPPVVVETSSFAVPALVEQSIDIFHRGPAHVELI